MPELKLIEAVKNGDLNRVETLLNQGEGIEQTDAYGWTALLWAAGTGHTAILRQLLEAGTNIAHVGRDQRTAYQIALAAAHVESASILQQGAQKSSLNLKPTTRLCCKAYFAEDLKQFPDWPEHLSDITDDSIIFLHEDLKVSRSMLQNEAVIFECTSLAWEQFCRNRLGFTVPTGLDLATAFAANKPKAESLQAL